MDSFEFHFDFCRELLFPEEYMAKFKEQIDATVAEYEKTVEDILKIRKNKQLERERSINLIKKRIDDLKITVDEKRNELECLDIDERELSAKIKLIKEDISKEAKAGEEISDDALNDLINDVVILEQEKENRQKYLTDKRDAVMKMIGYYKVYLDCKIEYQPPDCFKFFFSKRDTEKWIMLRSDDFKFWEFVDTSKMEECKKRELKTALEDSNNPAQIIARAREMLKT